MSAIEAASSSLVAGESKTLDSYRDMCGYIRGLREAINILDEIESEYSGERNNASTSN